MRGPEVQERKDVVGKAVADDDCVCEVDILSGRGREAAQGHAEELGIRLADGVGDGDVVGSETERGQATQARQLEAHGLLGRVGKRLADVIEGEEAVATRGQMDGHAGITKSPNEPHGIWVDDRSRGDGGPVPVGGGLNDRGRDG